MEEKRGKYGMKLMIVDRAGSGISGAVVVLEFFVWGLQRREILCLGN